MHRTDKYQQNSSIIWLVWLNSWVFVYRLSSCGFQSRCEHLNFRYRSCFDQGVPWNPCNCRTWIQSETRKWHAKNIQSRLLVLNFSYYTLMTILMMLSAILLSMLIILISTQVWLSIWSLTRTRIDYWTLIWYTKHCGLGQKVACWFQCWKNWTGFFWPV